MSFRIIYFCQFVSIDVVLLHLARTLGNVVYYVKMVFPPASKTICWVVPSSVILHFSALSHRIESGFDKSPLMSTPFFVLAACSEDWPTRAWQEQRNLKKDQNKSKIQFEQNLTNEYFTCHHFKAGKKKKFKLKFKSNFDHFFPLLCPVSLFRWLCLRLLWLPRVCDIDVPPLLENPKLCCSEDKNGQNTQ